MCTYSILSCTYSILSFPIKLCIQLNEDLCSLIEYTKENVLFTMFRPSKLSNLFKYTIPTILKLLTTSRVIIHVQFIHLIVPAEKVMHIGGLQPYNSMIKESIPILQVSQKEATMDPRAVEDLTCLQHLSVDTIVKSLKSRWMEGNSYVSLEDFHSFLEFNLCHSFKNFVWSWPPRCYNQALHPSSL